jgi:CBS domain-containing protein
MEADSELKASDIMTRKVVTVGPEDRVKDIAGVLSAHAVSAVPVCDVAGHLLGIVSEGDLMLAFGSAKRIQRAWWLGLLAEGNELAPDFVEYLKTDRRPARDIMTSPAVTASEDTSVSDLADLMISHRIKRVPIMRTGALVGVVARADIVRTLVDRAAKLTGNGTDPESHRTVAISAG